VAAAVGGEQQREGMARGCEVDPDPVLMSRDGAEDDRALRGGRVVPLLAQD
jgi:hypothetical protein